MKGLKGEAADLIHERLEQSVDRERMDSLFYQAMYAFGEPWPENGYASQYWAGTKLPIYPDLHVRWLEPGISRQILNSTYTAMSKYMSAPIDPQFPQLDKYSAEMRSQWFKRCSKMREWAYEICYGYLDMDALGMGGVDVGFEEDAEGYIRTKVVHVGLLHPERVRVVGEDRLSVLEGRVVHARIGRGKLEIPHAHRSDGVIREHPAHLVLNTLDDVESREALRLIPELGQVVAHARHHEHERRLLRDLVNGLGVQNSVERGRQFVVVPSVDCHLAFLWNGSDMGQPRSFRMSFMSIFR